VVLQGSIPAFTVVDIMHLLSVGRKTGVVRFSRGRGGITQGGAIYFRDGCPVAAESDGRQGMEALELLCSWNAGSFVYHDGATSPRENLEGSPELVLERAVAAQEEWQAIWRVLRDASAVVRPVSELPPGVEEVRLGREQWRLVAGLSGPQVVSALAQRAGGGLLAYRMLRKLAEDGLLRVENWDQGAGDGVRSAIH